MNPLLTWDDYLVEGLQQSPGGEIQTAEGGGDRRDGQLHHGARLRASPGPGRPLADGAGQQQVPHRRLDRDPLQIYQGGQWQY